LRRSTAVLVIFILALLLVGTRLLLLGGGKRTREPARPADTPPAATGSEGAGEVLADKDRPAAVLPTPSSGVPEDAAARPKTPGGTGTTPAGGGGSSGLETEIGVVRFEDTDLREVFDYIGARTGLTIVAPAIPLSGDEMKVTLHADGIRARALLDLVTLTKGLTWKETPDGTIEVRRE
jgi:hypothetical protein